MPDGIEAFRCEYCGSKCQVKASGSVRGLALLEAGVQKVVQHTERSADYLEELVEAQREKQRTEQRARDDALRADAQSRADAKSQWEKRLNELNTAWSTRGEAALKTYRAYVTTAKWVYFACALGGGGFRKARLFP
ncbi:MAG: hypothetical protein IT461_06570 [Planctomycetes bacterium]|nr:hypothetical protein [Planctomycetota bacterium]